MDSIEYLITLSSCTLNVSEVNKVFVFVANLNIDCGLIDDFKRIVTMNFFFKVFNRKQMLINNQRVSRL